MTWIQGFLLVFVLGHMTLLAGACSCLKRSLQDIYCDADFVIRVKIVSKAIVPVQFGSKIRYGIQNLKRFRTNSIAQYNSANKDFLWTADNSAACGVTNLIVGKTYLITGSFFDNNLNTNSCQWNPLWSSLTCYQQKAVKTIWKKECGECKIKLCSGCVSCYGVKCGLDVILPPQPTDTCVLDQSRDNWQCYQKFSVCGKRNNKCSFKSTPDLVACKS